MKSYEIHKKIIATLCYVQDGNKTLMLHRNKKENDIHEGKYNGLGGKSEIGEDPYSCVIREIKEEAGIDIDPIYVACLTFEEFTPGSDWEVHVFRTEGYNGELIDCNEGELHWIENDKVLDLSLWEGDSHFLKKVLNKDPFFFANFTYANKKLSNYKIIETKIQN